MSDLIKRSDAIEAITFSMLNALNTEERISLIMSLPSADLNAEFAEWAKLWFKKELEADRPRGEWIKDDEGTFICSACGSGYKDQPTIMGKPMFEWCPFCGAHMKGADDE